MDAPALSAAVAAPARRSPGRRRRLITSGLVAAALALAGCSSAPSAGGKGTGGGTPPSGSASASVSATGPKEPAVQVDGDGSPVSYLEPVRIEVADGSFESVQVSLADSGEALEGDVAADRASWLSQGAPRPASSYQVVAQVKDAAGQVRSQELAFKVAAVPDDKRVSFSVTPNDGTTVGIGQPIVVRFQTPVTRRAELEKVMQVEATPPGGGAAVVGGWHWLGDTEVHWRPKDFWTPGTTVRLDMRIAGVQASPNRTGRKDYSQTFTIGSSHITRVDGTTHRTKVYRDGKLVSELKSGGGKKGLETYSGTYIVLGKDKEIQMDSCSARITCDKKAPDYYDEKEFWATRITASGTFLHAASWDGQLGRANVSHGCVHLSDSDAKEFYNNAVIGDVVIVSRTGRGPQERIATKDPGLYDWNLTWAQWQAGSALK
jgi:lipoprotein-anchoring transpeptidase ErfK/SrfK